MPCDIIKLRGVPKADATKQALKGACGRGNDLGYSNNASDATMDNPQPSPKSSGYGCSSTTKWWWVLYEYRA